MRIRVSAGKLSPTKVSDGPGAVARAFSVPCRAFDPDFAESTRPAFRSSALADKPRTNSLTSLSSSRMMTPEGNFSCALLAGKRVLLRIADEEDLMTRAQLFQANLKEA